MVCGHQTRQLPAQQRRRREAIASAALRTPAAASGSVALRGKREKKDDLERHSTRIDPIDHVQREPMDQEARPHNPRRALPTQIATAAASAMLHTATLDHLPFFGAILGPPPRLSLWPSRCPCGMASRNVRSSCCSGVSSSCARGGGVAAAAVAGGGGDGLSSSARNSSGFIASVCLSSAWTAVAIASQTPVLSRYSVRARTHTHRRDTWGKWECDKWCKMGAKWKCGDKVRFT